MVGSLLAQAFASEAQFWDAVYEASTSGSTSTSSFRCGNIAQTCCKGKVCNAASMLCCAGKCVDSPRDCAAFGSAGQRCCGGVQGKCATGFNCDTAGMCQTCGTAGRRCCGGIGGTCATKSTLLCDADGKSHASQQYRHRIIFLAAGLAKS